MATMQGQLMRMEQAEDSAKISDEGLSSPIAQQLLGFCDDGGGGDLYPIDDPSPPSADGGSGDLFPIDDPSPSLADGGGGDFFPIDDPSPPLADGRGGDLFSIDDTSPPLTVSSADMTDHPSATTDATPTTDLSIALSNFESMDPTAFNVLLETPIPSDPPSDKPLPQLQPHTQQQQQLVPSISYNSLLLQSTQSLNNIVFSTKDENKTKASQDMINPAPQFLMKAPPTSLGQVPMQIQQQGGLLGIGGNFIPLQMIHQNNTDPQRFYHPGGSSNDGLPIDLEGVISPFSGGGRGQLRRMYSSDDLQAIRGSQNVMAGCSESNSAPVLASTEPSAAALEESSSFKVGRLTQEERRAKIDRYIRKRNERNFKKKIKYACRKTLADSRPRVRGRFAKNDELDEPPRRTYSNESYDDEGTSSMLPVKKDEDVHITDIENGTLYLPFPSNTSWSV